MTDHDYMKKAVSSKNRNIVYCCVPQCKANRDRYTSLHLFPKDVNKKKKWETALKMDKPATSAARVCSSHFKVTDYFRNNTGRPRLFPHAVPSLDVPKRSSNKKPLVKNKKRIVRKISTDNKQTTIEADKEEDLGLVIEIVRTDIKDEIADDSNVSKTTKKLPIRPHTVCMPSSTQANLADFRIIRPQDNRSIADFLCDKEPLEKCTQVNFLPLWEMAKPTNQATLSDLLSNDINLFTFTGIHSIDLLETLASCVSELTTDTSTNKKILSVRDRVILTMVKIKQNMTFTDIGVLCGITRQTCTNYFNNMCPLLNRVLEVVIPWPDSVPVHSALSETIVEKCICLNCKVLTYSQYKKANISKFNIRITTSGLITEIGTSLHNSSASDTDSDNGTGILDDAEFYDGVIVDDEYRIEFDCNQRLHKLGKTSLNQKKLMTKEDKTSHTTEAAHARVVIKKVIHRIRQYKLLCGPIQWSLAPYFDDILNIVGGLTNLGPPIVSN